MLFIIMRRDHNSSSTTNATRHIINVGFTEYGGVVLRTKGSVKSAAFLSQKREKRKGSRL